MWMNGGQLNGMWMHGLRGVVRAVAGLRQPRLRRHAQDFAGLVEESRGWTALSVAPIGDNPRRHAHLAGKPRLRSLLTRQLVEDRFHPPQPLPALGIRRLWSRHFRQPPRSISLSAPLV